MLGLLDRLAHWSKLVVDPLRDGLPGGFDPLFDAAEQLIEQHKLQLLDALHLAAAISLNAEFITAEKPTKPFFSAYPKAISIHFAK